MLTRLTTLFLCFVAAECVAQTPRNLRDEQLVAWCIVPFDAKNRGPAERAEMLRRIGLRRVAYDWRQQHVPSFEEEILQYRRHGIEYFAFWGVHEEAFRLFEKHGLHPQIWQTLASPEAGTQEERIRASAEALLPLVERTRELGCKLGLYNHGGWGGEPDNLVAVCEYLKKRHGAAHVGIVYNQHHGHGHVDGFAARLEKMKPWLLCLNLNGMTRGGDRRGQKILPLGEGELDVSLLGTIRDSRYEGPIGIIGHTQDDVELRLRDNLDGLHWLLPQLEGKPPGPRPSLRTGSSASRGLVAASRTHSPQLLAELVTSARRDGDAHRGLVVFAGARAACLSCHRIGSQGGTVGPELTAIGKQRSAEELVESTLWPGRRVEPQYLAHLVVDRSGSTHQGYILGEDAKRLLLRDVSKGESSEMSIALQDIVERRQVGTLMPENLAGAMFDAELSDLLRFLMTLGTEEGLESAVLDSLLSHAQACAQGPAEFPIERRPLDVEQRPSWQHPVNRDRVYDFYAKQAEWFRKQPILPPVLAGFRGLDGGEQGHWGNQNDSVWADGRWRETDLGRVLAGVFRGKTSDGKPVTVPRGVCVRLGDQGQLSTCFNPDTLTYDAAWRGRFVEISDRRHGFIDGLRMGGEPQPTPEATAHTAGRRYRGYYRCGERVVFSYSVGGREMLDLPELRGGRLARVVAPADSHPLRAEFEDPPAQWPELIETEILHGEGRPWAIDRIGLPFENPWKALLFCSGHAFLADGSALVCTVQGDVWRVSSFAYPSRKAVWRRFASGLHQPLGIVVDADGVFVCGRDQITRLHDLNADGEADFYECYSRAFETSAAGHDFICGLERDAEGRFYIASGNQGLVRISADGQGAEVLATGFRNPDGLGLSPDGTVTVPCSEGAWTPASMICEVQPSTGAEAPHFGHGGPRGGAVPALPLAYLPRGLDNSSGGQVFVPSEGWGPLSGQLLHLSFGSGRWFLVLRDQVDGQPQGAVVPLPGEFRSGAHRGRFSPNDGQLYVSGMQGWGSYTPDDGCFQRVRYVGEGAQDPMPTGFRVHENGIAIEFSEPLDASTVEDATSHFAQCWNYRYGPAYGSPELAPSHQGMPGHDTLRIASARRSAEGRTLFLELPGIQPVNLLHLRVQTSPGCFRQLFVTVHALAEPFTGLGVEATGRRTLRPHPIHADLAMATRSVPNPHRKKIVDAREITLETATNLSFATRTLRAQAGEPIALTLVNPDVVPHNWALAKSGTLERVGELADRFISDPEAALRHYVPSTSDVLAWTDVVYPRERVTIWFRAPELPGRYPYLCTFPGHWKVMNGVLIVGARRSP